MMKLKGNNKGLSLIELLVALIIGSILAAGIGSIMVVSSRSFSATSAEAAMQSSAQIVMDHIQDVVVDANQKVLYSYTTVATPGAGDWNNVTKDAAIPDPESAITHKKLSVYTFNLNQVSSPDAFNQEENKHYDIIWHHDMTDDEKSTIEFVQEDLVYNGAVNDIIPVAGTEKAEKLADNVKSFKCDLTDMEKKRIIYVEMDFSKSNGKYEYHVANNVSLRNKVAVSTDSISVNKSVTLDTLALTAEPGMDLPLTIKKIITTGNASNSVVYELDGGDGGRTSSATDLSNPTTLHIDATERAAVIKMNAVDSLGGVHPFDVFINRVKWTDDNAAHLGQHDDVEGIELVDRPEHDEVDAGTIVPITVKLNSNPGAPGIDRTRPERISASINKIEPATAAAIKLESAGDLAWMLDVPASVRKDTKITIRFIAGHSLADGGIATRTQPYPEADGVYKDLVLTVTEAGVAVNRSPFLRGMRGRVIYPEYLEQFFNEAGRSEWEQYRRIPQNDIDKHYLVWKAYASRPAVDGSKNHNYSNNSAGWNVYDTGATSERYDDLDGYQAAHWNVIYGGKEGNFNGNEFASLSPDQDTGIVFAILVHYKQNNVEKWFCTSPASTMLYGFREMISKVGSYRKVETNYDVGSFYKLDTNENNDTIRNDIFGDPDGNTWLVWQKEACFDNLSFGGNDGGLSISTYLSDKAFEGGESLGSKNNVEENWGGETYTGNHTVYMARVLPMKEIKNKINNNFYNNLNEEKKEYYIWPKFEYNRTSFDRTSGYIRFFLKQGNITLKNSANSNNKMEGFVPYPAYTTEDGFEIPEHPGFYGKGYGLDSTFTSVNQRTIRHYENANFSGNQKDDNYECMMRVEDGVYYLKINGLAVYRFSNSSQRWEFEKADRAEANMITGLYANNGRKDVYLPGPGDDEFYTGFKDIANLANTEKRFANRIAVYKAYNGVAMLDDYKIAYYRRDNRYCVDIYTLDNKNLYKTYYFDEVSGQWISKGDMFSVNITETYFDENRRQVTHSLYLPTKDDIEWFDYRRNSGDTSAAGIKRYQKTGDTWSELPYTSRPSTYYRYNTATNDLRVNICYWSNDPRIYKYDFVNNKWNRVNGWE